MDYKVILNGLEYYVWIHGDITTATTAQIYDGPESDEGAIFCGYVEIKDGKINGIEKLIEIK